MHVAVLADVDDSFFLMTIGHLRAIISWFVFLIKIACRVLVKCYLNGECLIDLLILRVSGKGIKMKMGSLTFKNIFMDYLIHYETMMKFTMCLLLQKQRQLKNYFKILTKTRMGTHLESFF